MVRTAVNNPFVPGSDHVPEVWAGRADELADWRDVLRPRRTAGEYERGRVLLGEPGIGKSVLANRIAQDAAGQGDIVIPPVRVPRGADALALVAGALGDGVRDHDLEVDLGDRAPGLLGRVHAIAQAASGRGGSGSRGGGQTNRHVHLQRVLVELGRLARDGGRAVLVQIDEIQNVTDRDTLSQVLVALGDALRQTETVRDVLGNRHDKVLPIAVYLTGLTDFADRASSVAGATFARRFQPVLLMPLDDADIRLALAPFTGEGWSVVTPDGRANVVMTDDAVDAVVSACLGDPFLLQLAGKAAWDAGDEPVISADDVRRGWSNVTREARNHVERALERLPDLEREFVDALAALDRGERTLTSVAASMGRRPNELATTARRLEDVRGIITRGRPYRFVARTVDAYLNGDWP